MAGPCYDCRAVALPECDSGEEAFVRWLPIAISILAGLVLIVGPVTGGDRAAVAEPPRPAQPEPTATDDTPIVDPEPLVVPLYMPYTAARYDETQPPPLAPIFHGYVAALTPSGRQACAPATHILLLQPEGTPGNTGIAALVQGGSDPNLTLDLYIAEYVEVKGTQDVAPEACRQVTQRLLHVREITIIRLPPGLMR